jgi:uncharacterized protein YbjT (DUF2867 family)
MPAPPRTALLAGATGLVGARCLARLLAHPAFGRVVVLARRPLEVAHPSLETLVVDFERPHTMRPVPVDDAFCALGTTIAKAGSQAAFRAVDYVAVLAVADLAVEGGARRFTLVSSVGADPSSGNFYLRTKGEIEAAVSGRPFGAVHLLRPGLLLGPRREPRPAEAAARAVMPWVNALLVGALRKYRAIEADTVAAAMIGASLEDGLQGTRVLEYDELVRLAAR